MIDTKSFLDDCLRPFHEVDANCFTAAVAAFPGNAKVDALANWWRDLPPRTRTLLSLDNAGLAAVAYARANALGFEPCAPAPTGHQIAICAVFGVTSICVGAAGVWYCRGPRGVTVVPPRLVIAAWRV